MKTSFLQTPVEKSAGFSRVLREHAATCGDTAATCRRMSPHVAAHSSKSVHPSRLLMDVCLLWPVSPYPFILPAGSGSGADIQVVLRIRTASSLYMSLRLHAGSGADVKPVKRKPAGNRRNNTGGRPPNQRKPAGNRRNNTRRATAKPKKT